MPIVSQNLDAAESIFFERELESVKSKTYDKKYPILRAREFIPTSTEEDPGAETVKYEQYDSVGIAKIISSYADDLPSSDVKAKEFRSPIRSLASSFKYNIQELRAAKMAGKPLDAKKAAAAAKAIEELHELLASTGDSAYGLLGLLNQPNATLYTLPNGVSNAAPGWFTGVGKSAAEILEDMNAIVRKVVTDTKGVEQPNMLLLPIKHYSYVSTTPRSTTSDTTILEFFLKNNQGVKVESWYRLTGAGSGGLDRMVAYVRDEDHLQYVVPKEMEMFPPQERNMAFVINCHARSGGVITFYPLSIAYGDGL